VIAVYQFIFQFHSVSCWVAGVLDFNAFIAPSDLPFESRRWITRPYARIPYVILFFFLQTKSESFSREPWVQVGMPNCPMTSSRLSHVTMSHFVRVRRPSKWRLLNWRVIPRVAADAVTLEDLSSCELPTVGDGAIDSVNVKNLWFLRSMNGTTQIITHILSLLVLKLLVLLGVSLRPSKVIPIRGWSKAVRWKVGRVLQKYVPENSDLLPTRG
jgi:hypothetical protein